MLASWKKSNDKLRQHIKKQRHYFADKALDSQTCGFSSSHVWTWELDNKKGWAPKNWCLQTVVLEKTLESPLDSKEIQPVNPKGNQCRIFVGRTDAKALIFWPLMQRSDSLEKSLMLGQIEGRRRRGIRGWDGWMASSMQWTWTWANFRRWWGTGKPDVLHAVHGIVKSQTRLNDWTRTSMSLFFVSTNFREHDWSFMTGPIEALQAWERCTPSIPPSQQGKGLEFTFRRNSPQRTHTHTSLFIFLFLKSYSQSRWKT